MLLFRFSFSAPHCPSLAANGPAAWRSGGVSVSDYTVQRDVFYLLEVSAETSRHFAKPQVRGRHNRIYFSFIINNPFNSHK